MEAAPRTSFSNLPGFSLGMINLVGTYKGTRGGIVADLVFGPRGSDAVFNAPMYTNGKGGSSSQVVNQLLLYYNISKVFRLSLGQFNTFFSYEVISPAKNYHYSTSYLFSYGPFNHTGLVADLDLKEGWMAKLAIMDPTDYTEFNPFNSYTIGGQLSVTKDRATANCNFSYGDPDGQLSPTDSIGTTTAGKALHLDLNATFRIGEKYTLGMSGSVKRFSAGEVKVTSDEYTPLTKSQFHGIIIYQTFSISKTTSIGLRTEYFGELNNGVGAIAMYDARGNASMLACTLSGNITTSGFRFIPEIRVDNGSTSSFHESIGNGKPNMISFNFAAVFSIPELTHKFKKI